MQSNPNEKTGTLAQAEEANHVPGSSRRKLLRLGVAPLILTIPGRSALAGACLSNQLSGRDYQDRGNCSNGWSPGTWGQPGGGIFTYGTTAAAWTAIGLDYGTKKTLCVPGDIPDKIGNCWSGGTLMSQIPSWLNRNNVPVNTPVRNVLAPSYFKNGQPADFKPTRHLIAAYMNARLSEIHGNAYNYVLTVEQLEKLVYGEIQFPPAFTTLQSFLDTTW